MDLHSLLASGDVDRLRQMLKDSAESPSAGDKRAEPSVAASRPSGGFSDPGSLALFRDRPLLKIPLLGALELRIRSVRTMGKILWPAGHAVALQLAKGTGSCPSGLVEIGAGAAAPSLTAAARGVMGGVVATDAFEANVALIRHNAELNGGSLKLCCRLDVSDHEMLHRVVNEHAVDLLGSPRSQDDEGSSLLLLACDMSYDANAISSLFASMKSLLTARPASRPLLLFARAELFQHMDATTSDHAQRHGFSLLAKVHARAAGVQDAISETYLTPCADDEVAYFFFAPTGATPAVADPTYHDHPAFRWFMTDAGAAGAAATAVAAEEDRHQREDRAAALIEELAPRIS